MKRIVILCTATLVAIGLAAFALGDVPRPKPTPTSEGKVIFHTGLQIAPASGCALNWLAAKARALGRKRPSLGQRAM